MVQLNTQDTSLPQLCQCIMSSRIASRYIPLEHNPVIKNAQSAPVGEWLLRRLYGSGFNHWSHISCNMQSRKSSKSQPS